MLKKGSSASTSKQSVMADYDPLPSPTTKDTCSRPSSSFLGSPSLFNGFASKGCTDSDSTMSPTSILDSKSFSAFINPFWSDTTSSPKTPKPESKIDWDKLDSRGVGLGLVDVLSEEFNSDSRMVKHDSRMVLFGSQLKIQIPPMPGSVVSPAASPKSPPEFGIKTRNSLVGGPFSPGLSSSSLKKSPFGSSNSGMDNANLNSPRVFSPFSASEMELSEEYTCVISHGPNPRTTHIFDDCVVESCCGVSRFSESRKENGFPVNSSKSYPSENFLSVCHYCNKTLGQGNDIYMYRGEKAFCSSDCRYREMMLEEGIETPEFDDLYGTPL